MFVDPPYTNSVEYTQFWEKLNRGESQSGRYQRFARGGKEVWIEACYSAVRDENGRVYKVVKYASDISKQVRLELDQKASEERDRQAQEELRRKVDQLLSVVNQAAQGNFTAEVTVSGTRRYSQPGGRSFAGRRLEFHPGIQGWPAASSHG